MACEGGLCGGPFGRLKAEPLLLGSKNWWHTQQRNGYGHRRQYPKELAGRSLTTSRLREIATLYQMQGDVLPQILLLMGTDLGESKEVRWVSTASECAARARAWPLAVPPEVQLKGSSSHGLILTENG